MKPFKRILIDLDDVLANFVGGACQEFGLTREDVEAVWELSKWDIVPPLSKVLCEKNNQPLELMSQSDFWNKLDKNEKFWINLQPLPWFNDIIRVVESFTDDWHIVTSPSWCQSSYSGKVKWIKERFGNKFSRFCITPHKELFAQPGVVLIDDRDSNVENFTYSTETIDDGKGNKIIVKQATGGKGIVFPRIHNSQHEHRNDQVKYIVSVLESWIQMRKGT